MRAYEMLKNEISIKERPFDLFWYFIFVFIFPSAHHVNLEWMVVNKHEKKKKHYFFLK